MATSDSPLQVAASRGLSLALGQAAPSSSWLSHSQVSRAPDPLLRFTDLISGPATGLGDGLGSGVIVTIWAQGVGDSQGAGKVYFTDSLGTKREAAHVYYWKRADGELPSGPARLWYSHLMQEIAFSIPSGSADGAGTITVETGGKTSNGLSFTVRDGNIYYIDDSGSDSATGSFNDPFLTYNSGAKSVAPAGSTIYFKDSTIGAADNPVADGIYINTGHQDDESSHYFLAGYPGTRANIYAKRCIRTYVTTGVSVSKLAMYSLSYVETDNGQLSGSELFNSPGPVCLQTCRWGRGVGNLCTDAATYCSDGQGGAIEGGRDQVERYKIYGNEVYDYSCAGASKLHHTTYLTIRDNGNNPQYESWEWDFNFMHGNHAKFGIHNYDEGTLPGDLTTPLNIKHNVIVQQAGAGISVGYAGSAAWSMDAYIENNLMIDVGGPAEWDGVDPTTSNQNEPGGISLRDSGLTGVMYCRDNLINRFSEYLEATPANAAGALSIQGTADNMTIQWQRNVSVTDFDFPFISESFNSNLTSQQLNLADNCWHYTGTTPTNAITPSADATAISSDPQITFDGAIATVAATSPLKGRGLSTGHDLYGVPRATYQTAGPVEALS